MLKFFRYLLIIFLLPVAMAACAKPSSQESSAETTTANFQAGKDYQLLSNSEITPKRAPQARVKVIEFFSYGCPACHAFEPALEAWLSKKPAYIDFERVPVVFEQGWAPLAQAYYAAKDLGVEAKLSPIIFKAIHEQGQDLTNQKTLTEIFVKNGVSQKDFESAYNFSPGIDAQMMRANALMTQYGINKIPTIIVAGLYKVNPEMVGGDANRLIEVVNYLAAKTHKGDK